LKDIQYFFRQSGVISGRFIVMKKVLRGLRNTRFAGRNDRNAEEGGFDRRDPESFAQRRRNEESRILIQGISLGIGQVSRDENLWDFLFSDISGDLGKRRVSRDRKPISSLSIRYSIEKRDTPD